MQIGLSKPICVYGRIKGNSLVGIHKTYPLLNYSKFPAYQFAYWQIIENEHGWVVLNALFV